MRTRTFSEKEKSEIKQRMIEAGLPMLKEKGMTHMSITKLTGAVGIGKSTFYSFYATKEEFVQEMLSYHRKKLLDKLRSGLNGKEKYSKEEGKQLIESMISNAENVYQNFSVEDELALKKLQERNDNEYPDLQKESGIITYICSMLEGANENLDFAVIANLMKIIVLTSEQKWLLHESGYERTIKRLIATLMEEIFEE